ncbi:hypothetical protein Ctob_000510 [Chrysochromulina tobinii]|uniref:Uncharacterized protein n=1 Tax=Chrysochromulina tobinii TaxID=1460289 RepID=A0A0M0J450_9EUKA|nr:hypothetical protein Ctob_000510 [Chrysochromulina tobinii]|eukprot:KOO21260.1 hypothetical protein Ctob_000510 [Chrysochromulina sp. CCMP291]
MAPQPSSPSSLPLSLTDVSAPVTATIAATAFAPTGPTMPLSSKLSDAILVSLLLWMALQTALTPSSLRLFKDKFRAVSPPVTLSALAISLPPARPMFSPDASKDMILLSLLAQMAAKMAPQPSSPSSLPLSLTDVNAPLTRRASAIAVMPSAV